MKGKCYDQVPYCPMAHALSLVGERWSLLIVRELLHGARRYTDLANGLPGIGTNILAARLKDLETFGVIEKKKLPPPYASTVYELTPYGKELDEVLFALGRWGARSLGPPVFEEELYPEWGLNALPALFDPEAARDLEETYVLKIGDDVFTAEIVDGRLRTDVGAVSNPDLVAEMDMKTLWALTSGEQSPADALKAGRVKIQGSPEALDRCFKAFHMAPRTVAA